MSDGPYIYNPYTLCTTIMLAGSGRIRLLQQAITSYVAHTSIVGHKLIVVIDDPKDPRLVRAVESILAATRIKDTSLYTPIICCDKKGYLGTLRNIGARTAMSAYSPTYLHFCDDDVYFRDRWFDKLLLVEGGTVGIVGGDRHPYHRPIPTSSPAQGFEQTDAVAGYSMLMQAQFYVRLGGFTEEGKGIGASEDWEICRKTRRSGMVVGYSAARPVLHCGLTNSNGQPATGADQILANKPTDEDVKGVIYE